MHINPIRSWGMPRPQPGAESGSGAAGSVRPSDVRAAAGMPMVRVIEGELLDKDPGVAAYDAARRWVLGNAAIPRDPDNASLYVRRAHAAIGSYLDTAVVNASSGASRAGLDLYA